MATVNNTRRYYLLKRIYARQNNIEDGAWIAKQLAIAGTALPATFPHLTALAEHGYTAVEDLDGADADELTRLGFGTHQAKAIMKAFANL